MPGKDPLTVAIYGSAHLDILSHVTSHKDTLDRPGRLMISYGGTGHNIAINLAHLGHRVRFVTVLADTMISRAIVDEMVQAGIDVRASYRQGLPDAGFSAHLQDGDLVSAVSSIPVGQAPLTQEDIQAGLAGADVALADCNLTPKSLADVVRSANAQGVPVWVAAVSEAKALKLLEMAPYLKARGGAPALAGVSMNERELAYLHRQVLQAGTPDRPGEATTWPAGRLVSWTLGCPLLETRDSRGVRLWTPHHAFPWSYAPPLPPARRTRDHWLGAGDHFLALVLHLHHGAGMPLALAVPSASRRVSADHGKRACHGGPANPLEEKLRGLTDKACRDPLTGLLNRAGMAEALEALQPTDSIAVLMVDIDHFKQVNDTHGHEIGDLVLRSVAGALQAEMRASDCLVRWGGEEIVAVLPETPPAAALEVAERLRRVIAMLVFPDGPAGVTVSIGVAEGSVAELEAVRTLADVGLYVAKENGRNQVRHAGAAKRVPSRKESAS